jgi:prolyl-tRNA synthetase
MEAGKAAVLRRDRLWNEAAKPNFAFTPRDEFVTAAPALLEEIQRALFDQAAERREANIVRGIDSIEALKAFFGDDRKYPGWIEIQWSKPEGAALDKVVEQLKALKLTFRNVPVNAAPADGACLFTGEPAVERILVARAY